MRPASFARWASRSRRARAWTSSLDFSIGGFPLLADARAHGDEPGLAVAELGAGVVTLDTGVSERRGVPFPNVNVKQAYLDAVERAGGLPLLVPLYFLAAPVSDEDYLIRPQDGLTRDELAAGRAGRLHRAAEQLAILENARQRQ